MRYELGDTINSVTLTPPAAAPATDTPAVPAVAKTDLRPTLFVFDSTTGAASFTLPPLDPATQVPLACLAVAYVPLGHGVPSAAQGFLDLPDETYPKARLDVTPDQFGTVVALPPPGALQANVPYLAQAIHGYAE